MTKLFTDIFKGLRDYISGQIVVAFLLGLGYAVAYKLTGLPFPLAVGMITGFLTFIPYIGPLIGFFIALMLSILALGTWEHAMIIISIYITGQIIEGYYLTPKLIGKKTGLHPFLVFVSIMAGGALFGIIGMIIAVPVALVTLIVLKFIKQKKNKQQVNRWGSHLI